MNTGTAYSRDDVPSQAGRTFLVTGANTGIGFETALLLAVRGARVLLGCRSQVRGEAAVDGIRSRHKDADVELISLDLADLGSVREAASQVLAEPNLDCLINNAGVAATTRTLTKDGFEAHFGVNHLGHFALTAHLLPKLEAQKHARIVTVSSNVHKRADIHWNDLDAKRSYSGLGRYGMSKLANLLFTFELERRLRANVGNSIALACHPGGVWTELGRGLPPLVQAIVRLAAMPVLNTLSQGALPTVRAATDTSAKGGDYFGPRGLFEVAGPPIRRQVSTNALSEADASRLWDVSVHLTGVEPLAGTEQGDQT